MPLTGSSLHDVDHLVVRFFGAIARDDAIGLLPHQDRLSPRRHHVGVIDATERRRPETGAIDDDVCRPPAGMQLGELGDVGYGVAFEGDAVLQTLGLEVGEVEGWVNADGCKFRCVIHTDRERRVVSRDLELRHWVQFLRSWV